MFVVKPISHKGGDSEFASLDTALSFLKGQPGVVVALMKQLSCSVYKVFYAQVSQCGDVRELFGERRSYSTHAELIMEQVSTGVLSGQADATRMKIVQAGQ